MERVDLPGAAHLVLADGVVHLDPERAVFDAMLAGWERQQRTRFLKDTTIRPRITLIRRLGTHEATANTMWTTDTDRIKLGSMLTEFWREDPLTDEEHAALNSRDRDPAEPMKFDE